MFRNLQDGVKILLTLNIGIFVLSYLLKIDLDQTFGLVPVKVWHGHLYQLVTYLFIHGNLMHIFLNMMGLFFFGPPLEEHWGTGKFLGFFIGTGVAGGLLSVFLNPNSFIPTVGASGAIYGILAANATLFPNTVIYIYLVIPVRAKWLVLGLGIYEFWMLFSGARSGISHEAHLGGLVAGGLYVLISEKFFGYRLSRRYLRRIVEQRWASQERERQRKYEELKRLREEADELLDKVNRKGLDSLTPYERKRLDEIAKRMRDEL
ncbi:MAG: rhomboid family intramembrane serine protease [bacterium]|nr:rhomboid family intramembrane serine protease [bacterium]